MVEDAFLAVGATPAQTGGVHAGDGGDAHDGLLLLNDAEAVLEPGVVLAAELVARVGGVIGDAVAGTGVGARRLEQVLEERAQGGQAGSDDADGELDAVPDVVRVVSVRE